jgi:glycosyltransferase involved in cell wall biosynthesis
VLLTFFELDQIQETERNILNQQKAVIVTSEETKQVFVDGGVTVPVHYVPLGYDTEHFYKTSRKYYADDVTSWLVAGKLEKRKATAETIQAWLKKFGNNHKHVLNLSIYNSFVKKEDNEAWFNQICGGKKYFNVNYLPYVKTLGELNDIYNCSQIVIDMSRGEGHSYPSFHTLGLGKHAIIHNASAMKGWANAENAVLVESSGKIKAADGMFFPEDGPFNVGNLWNWEESALMEAFDKVMERKNANKINEAGLLIPQNFTWSKTVDKILEIISQ